MAGQVRSASGPVRFGLQLRHAPIDEMIAMAQRAERVGFDVVLVSDHVGPLPAPFPILAAIAQATTTIRLGTYVLNAEMRNPVQLAWEATTLDHISGGRFELGLGAGHTPAEFAATGIECRPARIRKERLGDVVEIVRRLLDGETVVHHGPHFDLVDAAVERSAQDRLPILVGGNGRDLLERAGRTADIIGLTGLGRTLDDGHTHTVRWDLLWLDEQVGDVRQGAGGRSVELNALVQVAEIVDEATASARLDDIAASLGGVSRSDVEDVPYVLVGPPDSIAAKIRRCGVRWGITYFVVRQLDSFGDVIAEVRAT